MRTYSLCCFIYYNNIKPTIPFTEKSWTTEAKGGEDLPVIQKSERKLHNLSLITQGKSYIQLQPHPKLQHGYCPYPFVELHVYLYQHSYFPVFVSPAKEIVHVKFWLTLPLYVSYHWCQNSCNIPFKYSRSIKYNISNHRDLFLSFIHYYFLIT